MHELSSFVLRPVCLSVCLSYCLSPWLSVALFSISFDIYYHTLETNMTETHVKRQMENILKWCQIDVFIELKIKGTKLLLKDITYCSCLTDKKENKPNTYISYY